MSREPDVSPRLGSQSPSLESIVSLVTIGLRMSDPGGVCARLSCLTSVSCLLVAPSHHFRISSECCSDVTTCVLYGLTADASIAIHPSPRLAPFCGQLSAVKVNELMVPGNSTPSSFGQFLVM